jgi:hypothetical protein
MLANQEIKILATLGAHLFHQDSQKKKKKISFATACFQLILPAYKLDQPKK